MNAKERYEKYKEKSMIAKERTNKLIFVFFIAVIFTRMSHKMYIFIFRFISRR